MGMKSSAPPRQAKLASERTTTPRTQPTQGPVEDWMAVALRPDLHQAPIMRKSMIEIGYAHDDSPPAASHGTSMPDVVQAKMEAAFGAAHQPAAMPPIQMMRRQGNKKQEKIKAAKAGEKRAENRKRMITERNATTYQTSTPEDAQFAREWIAQGGRVGGHASATSQKGRNNNTTGGLGAFTTARREEAARTKQEKKRAAQVKNAEKRQGREQPTARRGWMAVAIAAWDEAVANEEDGLKAAQTSLKEAGDLRQSILADLECFPTNETLASIGVTADTFEAEEGFEEAEEEECEEEYEDEEGGEEAEEKELEEGHEEAEETRLEEGPSHS